VVGDIDYAKDGEWAKPRTLFIQFQNIATGDLDRLRNGKVGPILWSPEFKTGNMICRYADAKKQQSYRAAVVPGEIK
jgi:branched-chain amino acid transport system substrate-binding protein